MTAPKYMNVVSFKLMPECVDQYFEVHGKFICEGLSDRYIVQTGEDSYCFVGLWESKEAVEATGHIYDSTVIINYLAG